MQSVAINHTSLLNGLIQENSYKYYLEIGIGAGANFKAIQAPVKMGVDPFVFDKGVKSVTSDAFFAENREKFDLIFIDGLHHYDQVKKDFESALLCLNEGGKIVIHDVWPDEPYTARVPRDSKEKAEWFKKIYNTYYLRGLTELGYRCEVL